MFITVYLQVQARIARPREKQQNNMESRSNIRQHSRAIRSYYDDGERGDQVIIYVEPREVYDATSTLATAQGSKVLFIQLPFHSPHFLNLSHELLRSIRDVRHLPCTWFFGSNRVFQGRYTIPQAKMLSLVSSMIAQLINFVPRRFNDPDMTLSQEVFSSLWLREPDSMGMAISIPIAINIIKALVNVIPHGILFFFEGCNDLMPTRQRPRDEICCHFANLLRFLARDDPAKLRKILWIESGPSTAFASMMSRARGAGDYTRFEYPHDWNDGRRRNTTSILTTQQSF
ncbi:hypothetical protein F5B19DRAFT_495071 [Rostrohypoxylon terebratum]|nr:hypothetical protein F5B19DRAFT_495071 [Rostrohypoxylon terebratum]